MLDFNPMKSSSRYLMRLILSAVSFVLVPVANSQTVPQMFQTSPSPSPFAGLKAGLRVTPIEKPGGLVEIQVLGDGKFGTHIVLETYPTFIVIEDASHLTKRWIPITAIQAVVTIKNQ